MVCAIPGLKIQTRDTRCHCSIEILGTQHPAIDALQWEIALIPFFDQLAEKVGALFPFGSVIGHPLLQSIKTRRSHAAGADAAHLLGDGKAAGFEDCQVLPYRRERDAEALSQLRDRHRAPAQTIHNCAARTVAERLKQPIDINSFLFHRSAFLQLGDQRHQIVGQ